MTDKRYMLYEEKKQMSPAKKMLLLLIPILLVAVGYGVYDYLGGSRVGSSTKLGEVYTTRFCGFKCYVWYLEDRHGNVLTHGIGTDRPYIYEVGDTVSITFSEPGLGFDNDWWTDTYDLTQNPASVMEETAERPMLDLLTYTGHKKFQKVEVGSEDIPVIDISLHEHPLYHWGMVGKDGELEWFDGSPTVPELKGDDSHIEVYYTGYDDPNYACGEQGMPSMRWFEPENGYFSDEFVLVEDGAVRLRMAADTFHAANIVYDESRARYDGFVNTEPAAHPEELGLVQLYELAKKEVTKPYSLVEFRFQIGYGVNPEIYNNEVAFIDDPDDRSTGQTVYMDAQGVTWMVLDGRPEPDPE